MQSITLTLKSAAEHLIMLNVHMNHAEGKEIIDIENVPSNPKDVIASGSYEVRRHPQDSSRGIIIHTQTQHTQAFHVTQEKGLVWLWLAGHSYCIKETTAKNHGTPKVGVFQAELKAPMPGKILQILTSENTELTAHQAVIVMESMKMELSLTVEVPCKITKILCQPNQLVEMNTVLATLAEL